MNIIVLGSGLIGLSSAYFLQKSGHQVTVIEQSNDVAMGASFANGGQISVGYSEPWASLSNLKKMKDWLGRKDSPILMHSTSFLEDPVWFFNFLKQCSPSNNIKNIKNMLKLSSFSRDILKTIRDENNIEYNQKLNGIITYYTSEKSFLSSIQANNIFNQNGCNRQTQNIDQLYELEPTLKHSKFKIYGGDYLKEDESGDARLFCTELFEICKNKGVKFFFNHSVIGNPNTVKSNFLEYVDVINTTIDDKTPIRFFADMFVCCLGSYSQKFLNNTHIKHDTLLYPVKGYSATIPILNSEKVNQISLTDSDRKIVLTRLGNELRIAGTAEFNGFNDEINPIRCEALSSRANELFPRALDIANTKYWVGFRPTTPHGSPYIQQSTVSNLYFNFGHGTLGFTMAAGSGKLISQLINKEPLFTI